MNFRAKPFIRMIFACLMIVGAYGTVAAIAVAPTDACAAGTPAAPTTPCDPQYMDALEARAWLEAQREISQNQNLIVKPDSVLEYSCFDEFLGDIAEDARLMFSETERWGAIPGLGSTSQDIALTSLIMGGLRNYIDNNFSHTYLGGRITENYPAPTAITPGDYACFQMRIVWARAKCINFFDRVTGTAATTNHDGFYDFTWYQTNDPRQLPPAGDGYAVCASPTAAPYSYENMQGIAFNSRNAMYVLAEENPMDATAYNRDNLVTFLNFILPVGVAPATSCVSTPIQTGVQVNRRMSGGNYPDAVCPNPGCYLTANGASCAQ